MNATETRKTEAIQAMHSTIGALIVNKKFTQDATYVAEIIRGISGTVNSPKWRNAVEQYANFVETNAEAAEWAYFQGSVYFANMVM